MKREIDLENENPINDKNATGNTNNSSAVGNGRKKIFDEGSNANKRMSEKNVVDTMWENEQSTPQALVKNQLYAASQKNIDTSKKTS